MAGRFDHGADNHIAGVLYAVHHACEHVVDAAGLTVYTIEHIAGDTLEMMRLLAERVHNLGNVSGYRLDLGASLSSVSRDFSIIGIAETRSSRTSDCSEMTLLRMVRKAVSITMACTSNANPVRPTKITRSVSLFISAPTRS